jgi:hypothetical protein
MLNSNCGQIAWYQSRVFARWLGLLLWASVSAASAQDSARDIAKDAVIGYIKTVRADAWLVIGGTPVIAQPGMAVQPGQVLRTGPRGSIGVTFKDNTIMALGPDTELVVDEYLYAPGRGDLKLSATLSRGTLQYISGIIARLKPEGVSVKTPVGIIGVRGTRYLVLVGENNT